MRPTSNGGTLPFTKVGHPSQKPVPIWFGNGMGSAVALALDSYTHTSGETFAGTDFPAKEKAIRADAALKYGSDYDKP